MIKGVIFDCFGVLVHGSLDHLRSLAPPARLHELNDLSHNSDYGYVSQADYLQGVGDLLGRSASEVAAIIHAQYVRNESMIALAQSLRGEYKVALLSNVGRGVIRQLFTPAELDVLFDAVILSSEVGMVKPHADAYELAAHQLDLTPNECLMIDDLPANIAGAEATGMQGVLCSDITQCIVDVRALLEEAYARAA
jgi:HAD superfamily hydrolase (TIGR01509 family)